MASRDGQSARRHGSDGPEDDDGGHSGAGAADSLCRPRSRGSGAACRPGKEGRGADDREREPQEGERSVDGEVPDAPRETTARGKHLPSLSSSCYFQLYASLCRFFPFPLLVLAC
ncbi:hypothetical protein BRADI_4g25482v3 [Brachypodium distachyon]|uniref:Uncharacterized protein n=1 Tax=Brachypodium distachyon TaxID=15368 RepID=A0A2K2CQ56_BRADI|nr:hypothetical protein BRADI_4g25482v3 [Brachypodium distachyon]